MVTALSIKRLASPRAELHEGAEASDVTGQVLPPAPSNVLGQPTQTSDSTPTYDELEARRMYPILRQSRTEPSEVPFLAWRRTIARGMLRPPHATAIDSFLGNVAPAGRSPWADAMRDDDDTGNALALLPIATASGRIDLVMTAVLRAAIDGDLAADMVILKVVHDYDTRHRLQHDRRPT